MALGIGLAGASWCHEGPAGHGAEAAAVAQAGADAQGALAEAHCPDLGSQRSAPAVQVLAWLGGPTDRDAPKTPGSPVALEGASRSARAVAAEAPGAERPPGDGPGPGRDLLLVTSRRLL